MTQQMLRYQAQPQNAKIKAPSRNDRIPITAIVGATLAVCVSTNAHARPVGSAYSPQTSTFQSVAVREEEIGAQGALAEIKAITGLTWMQIADLLTVSRKRLHDWNSGARLRDNNLAKIAELLDRTRSLADLPKFKIRNALLGLSAPSAKPAKMGPLVVSDNTPPRHRPTKLVGSMTAG